MLEGETQQTADCRGVLTAEVFSQPGQGTVSLYNALVHSINIPAVALLHEMGIGTGIEFISLSQLCLLHSRYKSQLI